MGMVASAQEVMVNGIDSPVIPETIKDWLAGKVLRSLPKRLTQKLLSFLLDNRDMEGTLGFRENQNGDIPEFTLLIYRTAKSKLRKERENPDHLLPQKIDENDVQNVFQGKAIENNGIEFFGNDIII